MSELAGVVEVVVGILLVAFSQYAASSTEHAYKKLRVRLDTPHNHLRIFLALDGGGDISLGTEGSVVLGPLSEGEAPCRRRDMPPLFL